jgi:hypothetical protein
MKGNHEVMWLCLSLQRRLGRRMSCVQLGI